jgi:hypothetical protein
MSPHELPQSHNGNLTGENPDIDVRRPVARYGNKILRSMEGSSRIIDLGEGLGELDVNRIRLRDALEEGHLRVYVRQEAEDLKRVAGDHKIASTVVALGVVVAGLAAIKYHKKNP